MENAFGEALSDMVLLYGKNSLIVRELTRIVKGLKNNVTLEKLLTDLGERNLNIRESGSYAQDHNQGQSQSQQFLHSFYPPFFFLAFLPSLVTV